MSRTAAKFIGVFSLALLIAAQGAHFVVRAQEATGPAEETTEIASSSLLGPASETLPPPPETSITTSESAPPPPPPETSVAAPENIPPPESSSGTPLSPPPPPSSLHTLADHHATSTPPPPENTTSTNASSGVPPGDGGNSSSTTNPPAGDGQGETATSSLNTASTPPFPGENGQNGSSTPPGNATSTDRGTDGTGGEDGAHAPSGPADVATGNAGAAANTLNNTNTNVVGSQGLISILNFFSPLLTDLDLRNAGSFSTLPSACNGQCSTFGNSTLAATNVNSSTIRNNIGVEAGSGSNVAINNKGISRIQTGSSAAASNIVNVANTNIVGSNYLLLVLNNFTDWAGDIIFPGEAFFSDLLKPSPPPQPKEVFPGHYIHPVTHALCHTPGYFAHDHHPENPKCPPLSSSFSNTNSAVIKNNVETLADTGGNSVVNNSSSTAPGEIVTGDARAASNILTVANTNVQSTDSVFILVRVFGNWSGSLMSPPPGLKWQETPNGLMLYASTSSVLLGTDAGGLGGAGAPCCAGGVINATNTNTAVIENNVKVLALTGDNKVGGGGVIQTGDATAVSNIVNLANTNIVGKNWLFALINIFGDWDGNLAFGRPDLWIGQRAAASHDPLVSGTEVTFYYDVVNNGDADATQITVSAIHDPRGLMSVTSAGSAEVNSSGTRWTIPSLPVGASTTVSYTARVGDNLPVGQTSLTVTAAVRSFETDANDEDNSDSMVLALQGPMPSPPSSGGGDDTGAPAGGGGGGGGCTNCGGVGFGGGGGGGGGTGYGPSQISISKNHEAPGPIEPSSTVPYHIKVMNSGTGSLYNAKVEDKLYGPDGALVVKNMWDLVTVYPSEEITIDYDANFMVNASSGLYVNVARIMGDDGTGEDVLVEASTTISIVGAESSGESSGGALENQVGENSASSFIPTASAAAGPGGDSSIGAPTARAADYPAYFPNAKINKPNLLASLISVFSVNPSLLWLLLILLIVWLGYRLRRRAEE